MEAAVERPCGDGGRREVGEGTAKGEDGVAEGGKGGANEGIGWDRGYRGKAAFWGMEREPTKGWGGRRAAEREGEVKGGVGGRDKSAC